MSHLECRLCKQEGQAAARFPNTDDGSKQMRQHLAHRHRLDAPGGYGVALTNQPLIKIPPAVRLDRPQETP